MTKNNVLSVEERIRKGSEKAAKHITETVEDTAELSEKTLLDIKKELESKTKTLEEYTNTLKRLQAEFENYSKRVERERQEYALYASEKLVLKLLGVLDSFEQALKNTGDDAHSKGVRMIFDQFRKVLESEGLQRLDVLNKEFNVDEHEALLVKDSEKPDNIIIEEIQPGYKLKNRVVRHARVVISKSKVSGVNQKTEQNFVGG